MHGASTCVLQRLSSIIEKKKNYSDVLTASNSTRNSITVSLLKVHKNENFFGFDFEFCPISLLVMHK